MRRCDESEEEEICNVRLCDEWGRDSQRHLRNLDREKDEKQVNIIKIRLYQSTFVFFLLL